MRLIQMMVAGAVLCTALLAQESPTTTPGTGGGQARAAKIISPEVHADGRITFRLLAPKAAEVLFGDANFHRETICQELKI